MLVGVLSMLINKEERRLGDLAAGTLVIKERKSGLATSEIKMLTGATPDALLDVGRVTPEEYDLLARFLRRREKLAAAYRPQVARRLEDYFRDKLSEPVTKEPEGSEHFLEKVFLAYQARAHE